jgi:hypothetical protein
LQEDPFIESDEWIAAEARQLFRAQRANDAQAIEVCLFYFRDYLAKTLGRHLQTAPRWQADERWLDGLGAAAPIVVRPGHLLLRDTLTWVATPGQNWLQRTLGNVERVKERWYRDPFEFELELCPRTGAFQSYTFRFGDQRPLSAKELLASGTPAWPERNEWAFVFHQGGPIG